MSTKPTATDMQELLASTPRVANAAIDPRIIKFANEYCDIQKFIDAEKLVNSDPDIRLLLPTLAHDQDKIDYACDNHKDPVHNPYATSSNQEWGAALIAAAQYQARHPGLKLENASEADLGAIVEKGREIYRQFKGKDASCRAPN